jgi:hypothetical protein
MNPMLLKAPPWPKPGKVPRGSNAFMQILLPEPLHHGSSNDSLMDPQSPTADESIDGKKLRIV